MKRNWRPSNPQLVLLSQLNKPFSTGGIYDKKNYCLNYYRWVKERRAAPGATDEHRTSLRVAGEGVHLNCLCERMFANPMPLF